MANKHKDFIKEIDTKGKKAKLSFEEIYRDKLDYLKAVYKGSNKKYELKEELESLEKMIKMSMKLEIEKKKDPGKIEWLGNLLYELYCFMGYYYFHYFLLAFEWKREPKKKFYPPRMKRLREAVDELQNLEEGKYDFLGISMPTRTGKSTLCIMFMIWHMGRHPNDANVMSGHSDTITKSFWEEMRGMILDNNTYSFKEIFGTMKFDSTAETESINLDEKSRFPTITCRSISGGLTGTVEVGENGVLYLDDLVKNLEESLNIDRLQKLYDAYLNTLVDRKKEGAKELMVATRWNINDPLGRIKADKEGNKRYKFLVIPALDEDGESNFDYDYNVGFSTKYYQDMMQRFIDNDDLATWHAKYQGEPRVREGLIFDETKLNYFYDLDYNTSDWLAVSHLDIAFGGGDYTSGPIAVTKDMINYYIIDVTFNKGYKDQTIPAVVDKMIKYNVKRQRGEANNGGDQYMETVYQECRKRFYNCDITSKRADNTMSKMTRILSNKPAIMEHFHFLHPSRQSSEYKAFFKQMVSTSENIKSNKHDDACDSISGLADMIFNVPYATVTAIKRPF